MYLKMGTCQLISENTDVADGLVAIIGLMNEDTELLAITAGRTPLPLGEGFGDRFGEAVMRFGSRRAVASIFGVATSTLQRYIAGSHVPPFDLCASLCAMIKMRMEWLAFGTGEKWIEGAARKADSQPVIRATAEVDPGMLASAIRITDEVLKKYGLRDQLTSEQFADLSRLVYHDLVRGAADDAAVASLGRILAIARRKP